MAEVRPRALIADDDRDIRDLVAAKLRQAGFDVTAVGDGAAALAAVQDEPPTIAIIDVMMPGVSGLDVVRQLRDKDSTIALILLSARSQEFDVEEGFALGADDYIIKPFSPKALINRVNAVLDRARE